MLLAAASSILAKAFRVFEGTISQVRVLLGGGVDADCPVGFLIKSGSSQLF